MAKMKLFLAEFWFNETTGQKYMNSARLKYDKKSAGLVWEINARNIPTQYIPEKLLGNYATAARAKELINSVIRKHQQKRKK